MSAQMFRVFDGGGFDAEQAKRTAEIWAKDSWVAPWVNAETDVFRNIARAYLSLLAAPPPAPKPERKDGND